MLGMLDPGSLGTINIPLTIVYSFLILLIKIQFPKQFKGTGYWYISFLLPAISFTLYYITHQYVSFFLFNMVTESYLFSTVLLLMGWMIFFGDRPPYLFLLIFILSGLSLPPLLKEGAIPPHVIHEFFSLLIFSFIFGFLIRKHREKHNYSSSLILCLYLLAVITTLIPVINSILTPESHFNPVKNMQMLSFFYMIRNSLILFSIYVAVMHQFKVNHTISMEEKDRLMRELELLSVTDALTGLYNRRGFDNYISYEFKQLKRNNVEFVIALGDIDFFKKVNDRYGHDCGDEVIKKVSLTIEKNIREQDCLARWGGEEFIIMQKGNSPDTAVNVIERIRKEIENTEIQYHNNIISITMSFGMAQMTRDCPNYDQVIIESDKNLYKAKQSGRNCTVY